MVAQSARLVAADEVFAARPERIRHLDAFLIAVPLRQPMKMSGVTLTHAENLLVRLESSHGAVGWGEAASAPNMTGDTPAGLLAAAGIIRETVQGADIRFRPALMETIGRALYGNFGAKSAFELALLDLIGRIHGISAIELLGGSRRATVEPMWLIGNATVEQDVADAQARRREGFRSFKLKIGSKAIDQDIEAARQVRKALGPDATLCADANGGLTLEAARRFVTGAAEAQMQFLEQPLPPHAIGGMAALQALGIMPIGADEGIHRVEDVEASAERKAMADGVITPPGGPGFGVEVDEAAVRRFQTAAL